MILAHQILATIVVDSQKLHVSCKHPGAQALGIKVILIFTD
jgi:hypothetical protein